MDRSQILPPLSEAEWTTDLASGLSGNVLNIHRIIAHNPTLMAAFTPLRNHIVKDSALTDRQRELLILRMAHHLQSTYEWQHHVVRGKAAGLTYGEIEQVKVGADAEGWLAEERTLLRGVDEVFQMQQLSVETATKLQIQIGNAGLLDALFTIGVYFTLGTVLKSFAVPMDDEIAPLG